jgi:hypothetical protein
MVLWFALFLFSWKQILIQFAVSFFYFPITSPDVSKCSSCLLNLEHVGKQMGLGKECLSVSFFLPGYSKTYWCQSKRDRSLSSACVGSRRRVVVGECFNP